MDALQELLSTKDKLEKTVVAALAKLRKQTYKRNEQTENTCMQLL